MKIYVPDFEKGGGLVTVVAQDMKSKQILMVAYANQEAVDLTVKTRHAHYYSRSRKQIWKKGETSGNTQHVRNILIDCDGDALIYLVDQEGSGCACHTEAFSCFFRNLIGASYLVRPRRLTEKDILETRDLPE